MAHNWEALWVPRLQDKSGQEDSGYELWGGQRGAGGWPLLGCELSREGPPRCSCSVARADIYCILLFKLQYGIDSLLWKFSPPSPSLSRSAFLGLSSSFSIRLVSLSIQYLMQGIMLH